MFYYLCLLHKPYLAVFLVLKTASFMQNDKFRHKSIQNVQN